MIGKVIIGASFKNCIAYCLSDKHSLSKEDKLLLAERGNVQHLSRAEVLAYNLCFGNAKELARDFEEVSRLSRRVEKPVFHITLRLAPGDRPLSKDDLTDIGRKCAEEFGVAGNQYLTVLHKDTKQQHIHLVANRVGLGGKAVSSSNNYRRMAAFCRKMEKEYQLTEVLSPRKFLSNEQRSLPRRDNRKEKLKTDIAGLLKKENINSYPQFEQQMKSLGYQIEKGRGICFIDDKNARIKGSDVGFSLMTLNKIFHTKKAISLEEETVKGIREHNRRAQEGSFSGHSFRLQRLPAVSLIMSLKNELANMIADILKPEMTAYNSPGPNLSEEEKKRRKRRRKPNF